MGVRKDCRPSTERHDDLKIIQLTPGAGGMYCGNCFRDNALVTEFRRSGHDALMVPLYLPLTLDEANQAEGTPIFFGGLNVYLSQKFKLFRRTPGWLRKLFNAGFIMRSVGRMAGKTRGEDVGELTLSMLRGEEGNQVRELEQLVSWLKEHHRPDVICLSNALLIGMARRLLDALGVPVVCLLEGEDAFLDSLPSPEREESWEEIRRRVTDVSLFIAPSRYYADVMAERAAIPRERLAQIYNGINLDGFRLSKLPDAPPVLGFFTRMCPEKGLDTLVDAYISLRQTERVPGLKLAVGGGCQPMDEPFVAEQKDKLRAAGLMGDATFQPNIDREAKLRFFRQLTVLSVPALYGEAFGLYVVEAMASGVPVVAPEDASFPEMIAETGAGVICEKGSAEALAKAIGDLLSDRERLAKCAEAGRTAVEATFNIQQMAEVYLERLAKLG